MDANATPNESDPSGPAAPSAYPARETSGANTDAAMVAREEPNPPGEPSVSGSFLGETPQREGSPREGQSRPESSAAAGTRAGGNLQRLALVTEAFRTATNNLSDTAPEDLYATVATALSTSPHTRCLLFLISSDGTRMRLVADPQRKDRGWQPAIGPIAQVLAAGRPIEMAVLDSSFDAPSSPAIRRESDVAANAASFGRFVPVFSLSQARTGNTKRTVGVLALLRNTGEPLFRADDRTLMDATVERIEMYLALRNASDAASGHRSTGVQSQNGLVIGDALMARLGRISGDVVFRHLFATGTEYISSGVATSLGYSPEEVVDDPFLLDRLIFPDDRHVLTEIASGNETLEAPLLMRFMRRDGLLSWQLLRIATITSESGRVLGVEGFATDVTAMKTAEAALLHQARSDPLTGLANRLNFREATGRALARIERHPGMIGVLFLDLDGFKAVNDTMGHAAGDQVLKIVADRLRSVIRREDLVARLGGDEFAVLLAELRHVSEGAASARRILDALEEPIIIDGRVASISTGVGIAVTTSGAMTPDELINQADIALYQAKRSGRGRWQVFQGDNGSRATAQGALPIAETPLDPDEALRASITAGALRSSFAGGEFRVHYLPEIDTTTGRIVAVEALVRWQHPVHGLLPASMFIGAATASEVIHPLGDWVLREACAKVAEWRERFGIDLTLRVNVALEQLTQPGFAETILKVLASTGLSPRSLGLDVSETVISGLTESQELTVDVLHRAGVGFAVDDFGTGTSSLRTLRRLPLSQIKIDRSLIDEVDHPGSSDEELVRLAINLAGSLGARVVAIGVERSSQLERLRAMQCAFFQGFFAGEARTAQEITALLEHGQPQLPGLS